MFYNVNVVNTMLIQEKSQIIADFFSFLRKWKEKGLEIKNNAPLLACTRTAGESPSKRTDEAIYPCGKL